MKLLEAVKYLAASAAAAVGVNNCKICVLRTLLNFHYPKTHSKEGVKQGEGEEEGEAHAARKPVMKFAQFNVIGNFEFIKNLGAHAMPKRCRKFRARRVQ